MLVRFSDVGSAGIHRDAFAYELSNAAWTTGNNVRFRNGFAERFGGHAAAFGTPSVAPYGVFAVYSNNTRYVVYAGLSSVYAVNGNTHTDITGTAPTGGTSDMWTGGVMPGGMFVLNNSVDVPVYWNGDTGTNLATLTDWASTTRCKSLRPFKNYLMAINVTKNSAINDRLVMWSHAADVGALPSSWTPASNNDAGEVDLDVSTPLVDGIQFGDNFLIFSETETVLCQYIGAPYVFKFQVVSRTHGLLAQRCAAVVPGVGVLAVTHSDVVLHKGQESSQSIIAGRMKDYLFDNLSDDFYERTFVTRNLLTSEIWICFPSTASTGSCDKALVWNFLSDTWATRDLPNVIGGCEAMLEEGAAETFASITTTFASDPFAFSDYDVTPITSQRLLLASAASTELLVMDQGPDFSGTNITALIERTGLSLDAPDKVKLLRAIRPRVDADAGTTINVYAGGSFDPEGDVTWVGPYTYTVGTDLKVDALISGRYLGIRFETTADAAWRLRSFDLDVQQQGDY